MEDVKKTYSDFHIAKQSAHVYPTEWVIRTILGKYQDLNFDKSIYPGSKILDLGFGDCRNMPLLKNCEFDIYGVEITDEIISLAKTKLADLKINATLKKGTNSSIPFLDNYFDYILACHSCYYVDKGTTFEDNLNEMSRVLKPNKFLIASLPAPNNFILKDCIKLKNGHVEITNDVFGLRNGYIFRTFDDKDDVLRTFAPLFKNIKVCYCSENFWGLQINFFLVVAEKK
jgi:SAM-dependent methyltransferase